MCATAQTGQYDTPTEDMYAECQELLQLFGLPYIIAPGEVRRHEGIYMIRTSVCGTVFCNS